MKIGDLRKIRAWCLRKRRCHQREHDKEVYQPTNLYRPRLTGRIEAYDEMLDRVDDLIKNAHDKWHDRRKR